MVSYPQPYPIVTHQSPAHGAGGGPGSQRQDSIGMGHVTRQAEFISAAVTHSTSTDSLHDTALGQPWTPQVRAGFQKSNRYPLLQQRKYSAHDFTNSAISDQEEIYCAFLSGRQLLIFASSSVRFRRLLVDLQIFSNAFLQHFFKLLSSSEPRFLFRHHANPSS